MNIKVGSIKYSFLLFLLFFSGSLFAQAEDVRYDNEVYDYLERLSALHIIDTYNNLERPLSRNVIAARLKEAAEKKEELNKVDKLLLNKFISEYEFELFGTSKNSFSLISEKSIQPFSQKNKYLYFFQDSGKASVFVNARFNAYQFSDKYGSDSWKTAAALSYGGEVRGTLLNKLGFYVKATDAKVKGNKDAAKNLNDVKFDYKFNAEEGMITGGDYFNNTEGYLTADFDFVKFKYGRDVKTIGYGPVKYILGENTPKFESLSMNFLYHGFSFSYMHGKLMGTKSNYSDPTQGLVTHVNSKYFVYHRFGFDSRHVSLGLGEMIVYSNRETDMSYLNPFAFYKSLEHSNQDRDNTMLFLDASNNSIEGLKISTCIMLDDLTPSKIGKGWYGNQVTFNLTVFSSNLNKYLPLDITAQYLLINPYVYTHRITDNSYANSGYSLTSPLKPNSSNFYMRFAYTLSDILKFGLDLNYSVHGANELNPDGSIKKNVGGNTAVGYRTGDSETVRLLEGVREYFRGLTFTASYEPWKDYVLSIKAVCENNDSKDEYNGSRFYSIFLFDFRL